MYSVAMQSMLHGVTKTDSSSCTQMVLVSILIVLAGNRIFLVSILIVLASFLIVIAGNLIVLVSILIVLASIVIVLASILIVLASILIVLASTPSDIDGYSIMEKITLSDC